MKGVSLSFHITCISPRISKFVCLSGCSHIEVLQALPRWAQWPMPYRFVRKSAASRMEAIIREIAERKVCDAVYAWGNISVGSALTLHQHGVLSIREATNCHQATAKRILDDAYTKVGLGPGHGLSEASIARENEFLGAMEYVFCPNSHVRESLVQEGVPESKLLDTSYGWSPSRLNSMSGRSYNKGDPVFLFVGSVSISKGAHLLMEYWARSRVKGRLVLAGTIEPALARMCRDLLARDDVVTLGYVSDVGALYRSADVFVFPSLVEGGPQVTYEAAGSGLPVITSPMGAGRIIRNNANGYIIDPYNAEAWIETIRMLANSTELRQHVGKSARESAERFTWSEVGEQRRKQLVEIIRHRSK